MGFNVVIAANVQASRDSENLHNSLVRLASDFNGNDETGQPKYPGKLIVLTGWSLPEQITLMAATDIQVQDSHRGTEAAGFTESNIAVNGGLQLAPTGLEGILQNQGIILNRNVSGSGNTLIPSSDTAVAYLEIYQWLHDIFTTNPSKFYAYQATSIRLSRVLDAYLPAAQYLREFNKALRRKREPLEVLKDFVSGRYPEQGEALRSQWLRKDLVEALNLGDSSTVHPFEETGNPELKSFVVRIGGIYRIVTINIGMRGEANPKASGHLRDEIAFTRLLELIGALTGDRVQISDTVSGTVHATYEADQLIRKGLTVVVQNPNPGVEVLDIQKVEPTEIEHSSQEEAGARLATGARLAGFTSRNIFGSIRTGVSSIVAFFKKVGARLVEIIQSLLGLRQTRVSSSLVLGVTGSASRDLEVFRREITDRLGSELALGIEVTAVQNVGSYVSDVNKDTLVVDSLTALDQAVPVILDMKNNPKSSIQVRDFLARENAVLKLMADIEEGRLSREVVIQAARLALNERPVVKNNLILVGAHLRIFSGDIEFTDVVLEDALQEAFKAETKEGLILGAKRVAHAAIGLAGTEGGQTTVLTAAVEKIKNESERRLEAAFEQAAAVEEIYTMVSDVSVAMLPDYGGQLREFKDNVQDRGLEERFRYVGVAHSADEKRALETLNLFDEVVIKEASAMADLRTLGENVVVMAAANVVTADDTAGTKEAYLVELHPQAKSTVGLPVIAAGVLIKHGQILIQGLNAKGSNRYTYLPRPMQMLYELLRQANAEIAVGASA